MTTSKLLSTSELMPLEQYAKSRDEFRKKAIAHRRQRQFALGENITLQFEDRLTVQYQIQEMLRVERIFEAEGIQDELDAYNPLIPDGQNLKATMLIEFADADVRAIRLAQLGGIEHRVYVQLDADDKNYAYADEDLDRSTEGKTSAVHFLRFEFTKQQVEALKNGVGLSFGIDDPRLPLHIQAPKNLHTALCADFD